MSLDHDFDPGNDEDGRDDAQPYEIEMPFVSVASKGGPHDDDSYTAGWEMGALDAELQHSSEPLLERYIHEASTGQADLIAMRRGFTATITRRADGWAFLRLTAVRKTP